MLIQIKITTSRLCLVNSAFFDRSREGSLDFYLYLSLYLFQSFSFVINFNIIFKVKSRGDYE